MMQSIGPYELIARLGTGGMAAVYRARDTRDGRLVALKVLHDFRSTERDYIRRFEQEARLAMRLEHEHIVRVFQAGEQDGQRFLAMELVEGETLSERLARRRRLAPAEVRQLAVAVARALAYAHGLKIIHRDVKPGNVLLGHDGTIKVSDFGIARALDATSQTSTGTFLGSIAYASPEAIEGRADPRGDLYSLGVVLYQALLGHVPFEAPSAAAVMRMHEREAPPDVDRLRAADAQLGAIIERLLEKDPDDRYQSAGHLLRALEGGGDAGGGRRGRILAAGGLLGGGALAAGAVLAILLLGGDDDRPEPTPTAAITAAVTAVATGTPTAGPATQTVTADFRTRQAGASSTSVAVTRTAVAATRTAASGAWDDVVGTSIARRTATAAARTPTVTPTPSGPGTLSAIPVPGIGQVIDEDEGVEIAVFFRAGAQIENIRGTLYVRGLGSTPRTYPATVVTVNEGEGRAVLRVSVGQALARVCGYEVTADGANAAIYECE